MCGHSGDERDCKSTLDCEQHRRFRVGRASSWLGGLADARIARVLKSIHEQPAQPLTIEALAGMSRSSFSERFAALVGQSPLRYRNECRLSLAFAWHTAVSPGSPDTIGV